MLFLWFLGILFIKNDINSPQNGSNGTKQEQPEPFVCYQLTNITFQQIGVNIACINKESYFDHKKFIEYDKISKLLSNISIYTEINFNFEYDLNDLPEEYLTKIISLIRSNVPYNAMFYDIYNATKIHSYRNFFHGDAEINIILDPNKCFLESGEDLPSIIYDNENWKKVCFYSNDGQKQSILRYNDNEIAKIKYIESKTLTLFIILIIVFIVVNLIILFIIVLCRYKKSRKQNEI